MQFSYEMRLAISRELYEVHNKNPWYMFNESLDFTEEQLLSITSLDLSCCSDVTGIEFLENLKKLNISSLDFTNMNTGYSIKNNININNISDFGFISSLTGLEDLTIENDINIRSLNISDLKNLKNLKLINNPQLEDLIGLDQLTQLQSVLIYGTHINTGFNIERYMNNTLSTRTNMLDINMYLSVIKSDRELAKLIYDNTLLGKTNITFGEYIGFLDFSKLTPFDLYDMYTKLDTLFRKNNLYNEDDYTKISFVYNYVAKNVKFDNESLKERNNLFQEFQSNHQSIPKYLVKNFTHLHSSYIAFHFKRANCEGSVNLMQFMFNMLGIKSFNVHCIDKRWGYMLSPNHSLIRVSYNDSWYYCDPTYDKKAPENYFLKTYNELESTHLLNDFELMISKEKQYDKIDDADFAKQHK